ncbi:hypothetical protein [Streptomyces sp. WAC07149]|nr:hypothetical protein [Streptomyces sp. WAC07149]
MCRYAFTAAPSAVADAPKAAVPASSSALALAEAFAAAALAAFDGARS